MHPPQLPPNCGAHLMDSPYPPSSGPATQTPSPGSPSPQRWLWFGFAWLRSAPVHDTASRSLGSPPRFLRVSTSKNSVSSPSPLFCGLHGCHVGLPLAPFGTGSLSSKSWLSQVTCGAGKGPCLSGKWRRRMAQAPGGPGGVGSRSLSLSLSLYQVGRAGVVLSLSLSLCLCPS